MGLTSGILKPETFIEQVFQRILHLVVASLGLALIESSPNNNHKHDEEDEHEPENQNRH